MARSYYSAVIDHPAEAVWSVIRPFGHYAWAGVDVDVTIEDGKAGDQIGAIRRFMVGERVFRQVLLAHSDLERSYTYTFCPPSPLRVDDYVARISVTQVVENDRAFIEWWATFDCPAGERDHWVSHFRNDGFARWIVALRRFMDA